MSQMESATITRPGLTVTFSGHPRSTLASVDLDFDGITFVSVITMMWSIQDFLDDDHDAWGDFMLTLLEKAETVADEGDEEKGDRLAAQVLKFAGRNPRLFPEPLFLVMNDCGARISRCNLAELGVKDYHVFWAENVPDGGWVAQDVIGRSGSGFEFFVTADGKLVGCYVEGDAGLDSVMDPVCRAGSDSLADLRAGLESLAAADPEAAARMLGDEPTWAWLKRHVDPDMVDAFRFQEITAS